MKIFATIIFLLIIGIHALFGQKVQQDKMFEQIVGRPFVILGDSVPGSERTFESHYRLQVAGLQNAEMVLNDLERKLQGDGYAYVTSTKEALTALLYKKKTARFIFFKSATNRQAELWFDRVFRKEDRYLKGVDLHVSIRLLISNQSSPFIDEVE